MKCRFFDQKKMWVMLAVGLVMALLGGAAGYLTPEDARLATRLAGFFTGVGTALAFMGGGVLLWRRIVGERKAHESELFMQDERGQAIAYKAQSATAIAAVLALVLMMAVATVRGDYLYMELGTVLCIVLCFVKLLAWYVYSRRM